VKPADYQQNGHLQFLQGALHIHAPTLSGAQHPYPQEKQQKFQKLTKTNKNLTQYTPSFYNINPGTPEITEILATLPVCLTRSNISSPMCKTPRGITLVRSDD